MDKSNTGLIKECEFLVYQLLLLRHRVHNKAVTLLDVSDTVKFLRLGVDNLSEWLKCFEVLQTRGHGTLCGCRQCGALIDLS